MATSARRTEDKAVIATRREKVRLQEANKADTSKGFFESLNAACAATHKQNKQN
jgi:hypothetical protein